MAKRGVKLTEEVKAVLRLMERPNWGELAGDYPRNVVHAAKFAKENGVPESLYAEGTPEVEWDGWDEEHWVDRGMGYKEQPHPSDPDELLEYGDKDWLFDGYNVDWDDPELKAQEEEDDLE